MTDNGLSRGQLAFMAAMLLAGVGLLAWAGYRAFHPRQKPDLMKEIEEDLEKRGFKPLSGELKELVEDPSFKPRATQVHPLLGRDAPGFALKDVDGKECGLSSGTKKPTVLVFYYGYHCPHCVSQLFALSKDLPRFEELGAEVVAISPDTPEHTREMYKKHGGFSFRVLSDPENKVAEMYRARAYVRGKDGEGSPSHATLLIDPRGKVVWADRGDQPFTDNRTLLVELARMR
jgi:peroxiredoxin